MADAASLTLLNPHADDFVATPLSFWLIRRRGLCKYKYLLDEPIRRGQRPTILIDGTLSSLIGQRIFNRLPRWLRKIILRAEIFAWLRQNSVVGQVDIHWSIDTIADRTNLYVFSYKNCVGAFDRRQTIISSFKNALINLSHYFIRTREKADNIAKLPNACLVADSDLSHNKYFQNFFPQSLPILVLPFVVNERFVVKRPLADRDTKCAATGSFHDLTKEVPHDYYRDFIEFFRTDTYHPIRKMLYQHREQLSDWLECRISPYRETTGKSSIGAKLPILLRLDVLQAEYFSFNIVDFYNEHRFAIVGEELSGAPAIGFFEAMACGCVMLGAKGGFYDGLDLELGTHYLAHNGTLDSIRSVILSASEKPQQLEIMARKGRHYIETNCSPHAVWDNLQRKLAQPAARPNP
jgi:hypothetical protein